MKGGLVEHCSANAEATGSFAMRKKGEVFMKGGLVEHCSANAEATGSNPVEAPKSFFSGFFAIS